MPFDWNSTFRSLHVGLPDDIARLKAAGYYRQAIARIDARLQEDWAATQNCPKEQGLPAAGPRPANPTPNGPQALSACMLAQREILRRLPEEYCYTEAQAVALLQAQVRDFTAAEFRALVDAGRIDWRFVEGEPRFVRRFDQTLLDCDAAFAARRFTPAPPDEERRRSRVRCHEKMVRAGQAAARITVRAQLRMADAAFAAALEKARAAGRDAVHLRAWLPLPAACPAQSDIVLDAFSEPPAHIAAPDAPQRTVCWEADLTGNRTFAVQYTYTNTAVYSDPFGFVPDAAQPSFYTGEEAPHIVFTPYLRALAAQLTDGATDPVQKAKRIYDYVTLNVKYHYQPAYFVLEDLPDRCARDRRGDCGIMALTFITLCRIAGIPARWQSGLAVGPGRCGCHDWAMFYAAPRGWMYADCSYGASMARAGDETMRLHYFGSIDPGRMAANSEFEADFDPPMNGFRADPYDNQSGELEADGVGLHGAEVESDKRTLRYEEL